MFSVILFLRLSLTQVILSILTVSFVWAGTKTATSSNSSSTHFKKQFNTSVKSKKKFNTFSSLKTSPSPSGLKLDMGILSLNLVRLGKMQTYNISVLLFLDSKETKEEVSLQIPFFKELVANMLYNFSLKELKSKTVVEKNYLEDLNIFVNKGSVGALKVRIIKV